MVSKILHTVIIRPVQITGAESGNNNHSSSVTFKLFITSCVILLYCCTLKHREVVYNPISSDNSELFEFQTFLKNASPLSLPLGTNSDNLEIENILAVEDPFGKTS